MIKIQNLADDKYLEYFSNNENVRSKKIHCRIRHPYERYIDSQWYSSSCNSTGQKHSKIL